MKPNQSQTAGAQFKSLTPTPARRGVESEPTEERAAWIARRAYQLYEQAGRQDGHALEHWLKAEEEGRGRGVGPANPQRVPHRPAGR